MFICIILFYWVQKTDAQISITTTATQAEGGLPVVPQNQLSSQKL